MELSIAGAGTVVDYLESPVSDGTIEENFEEALVDAPVIETGGFGILNVNFSYALTRILFHFESLLLGLTLQLKI